MRSAMFRYVAMFRGGVDRDEVDRTFSSALFLVSLTAILISILSVGVSALLPRWITLQGTPTSTFRELLLLLGLSVAVTFPTRMLGTYISAHQRWDLYNGAGIVAIIIRAIAIVVVLSLGHGLLAIAVATLVISVLSLGQHVVFVRIADRRVHASMRLVSGQRIRELFTFSVRSLLVSVGDYLRFYSDSAVIAAVLNVGLVTPFNVATRLIECFKCVVIAAGGPVLGTMTELDGGRRREDLRELLLSATRLLGLLSVLGGVLLLVDGRPLLRLWVGNDLVSAYPLVAVLAFGYMINLAQHPTLLFVIAKGQHGPLGWWTIAEGIANIALSVVWGRTHGLMGVAMGTIVPMLVVKIIIQPIYALRAAEMSAWEYISRGLGRPILVGFVFMLVAGRVSFNSETTAPLFVSTVALQFVIFFAVAWFIGLTRDEQVWLRKAVHRHFRWPVLQKRPVLGPERTEADS
jgi:O-antigen/teichoic acid export membrane protein